jgi:hypothetical protein
MSQLSSCSCWLEKKAGSMERESVPIPIVLNQGGFAHFRYQMLKTDFL